MLTRLTLFTKVSCPVVGVPHCHQQRAELAYYHGDAVASNDPEAYLESIRRCVRHYRRSLGSVLGLANARVWCEQHT